MIRTGWSHKLRRSGILSGIHTRSGRSHSLGAMHIGRSHPMHRERLPYAAFAIHRIANIVGVETRNGPKWRWRSVGFIHNRLDRPG